MEKELGVIFEISTFVKTFISLASEIQQKEVNYEKVIINGAALCYVYYGDGEEKSEGQDGFHADAL